MSKKLNVTISKTINYKIILKAELILNKLPFEPDIFETFRNSIQFEYEKTNGDYLELEIYENVLDCLLIENGKEEEIDNITEDEFIEKLKYFYKN